MEKHSVSLVKELPLLMTASISTRGMKGAMFSDDERLKQYYEALRYYVENLLCHEPRQRIVFVENSGYDLSRLKSKIDEKALGQIEFISLDPDDFDITKGKGYNELLLIGQAIKKSRWIVDAGAFMKVTGRYPIYNVGYFLAEASNLIFNKKYDLYCDIKDHKIYDWLNLGWTGHAFEARLFACTNEYFLSRIFPVYTQCNDIEGRLVETEVFPVVKQDCASKIKYRFSREMRLGGVAGHTIDAASFSARHDSVKNRIKVGLGNFLRIFFPFFKF